MPSRVVIVADRLNSYTGYRLPAMIALEAILNEVNLKAPQLVIMGLSGAHIKLRRTDVVVAFGTQAAAALIPDWKGSVEERRGYIFEGHGGYRVIPTKHTEDLQAAYIPWRTLISYDLQRAKEEAQLFVLRRPERNVHVVSSPTDAKRAADELCRHPRVAFDIEISSSTELQCVGFATDRGNAVVFPKRYCDGAFRVLRDPSVGKIAQNGQFDLHFLLTRCDVKVEGYSDDTLVGWHCAYPELAGGQQEELTFKKKGTKRTHKSLAFLASIFTKDAWWKDYDTDEAGMYILNGKDCCITFECMEKIEKLLGQLNSMDIYRHEMSLIWPCVMMQTRGLNIDNAIREIRLNTLAQRIESADERLNSIVAPLLAERLDLLDDATADLFRWRNVCDCCRNGSGKRSACWACAGFDKKPGKRMLDTFGPLEPCRQCQGRGAFEGIRFNPKSGPQKVALLYDILKLPKRYTTSRDKDGSKRTRLSTDEDALKGLLANLQGSI